MSRSEYRVTPNVERATIRIDAVDKLRRHVHVIDKTGGKFKATYIHTDTTFQMPQPGELWGIVRNGFIWYLDKRVDKADEAADKDNLDTGDAISRVPGIHHIKARKGVSINGKGIGPTIFNRYVFPGGRRTVALSERPRTNLSVQVFTSGLLVDPNTLAFDSPPNSWSATTAVSAPTSTMSGTIFAGGGGAFEAQNSGTTAAAAPPWPANDGDTISDNDITWKRVPSVSLAAAPSAGVLGVIYFQTI